MDLQALAGEPRSVVGKDLLRRPQRHHARRDDRQRHTR
jgi:hypothetical protein